MNEVNEERSLKTKRVLELSKMFEKGERINRNDVARKFGVSTKTIRRDFNAVEEYLQKQYPNLKIECDDKRQWFYLNKKVRSDFDERDIYALAKILLESRGFTQYEMKRMIDILISFCDKSSNMDNMIKNDMHNYIEPRHKKDIINTLWKINTSIIENREAIVTYKRENGKAKEYTIRPLDLVFNEHYFYLIGEIVGKALKNSLVFRVDRFLNYDISEKRFMPKEGRLKSGELSNRIQFMYTGDLMTIEFKFWGDSLEAVLDRLPTATVVREYEENQVKVAVIKAEVYGEGVKRWLLSQKEFVEVIRPESYRNSIKETIEKMYKIYK